MSKGIKYTLTGAVVALALAAVTACSSDKAPTATPATTTGAITALMTAGDPATAAKMSADQPLPAKTDCTITVSIPDSQQHVQGEDGVDITTAYPCLQDGHEVYAFDSTEAAKPGATITYYLDGPNGADSTGPVMAGSGTTTWHDGPVGDEHVTNQPNFVTEVDADAQCQHTLDSLRQDTNGDITLDVTDGHFPDGCTLLRTVKFYVSNP